MMREDLPREKLIEKLKKEQEQQDREYEKLPEKFDALKITKKTKIV